MPQDNIENVILSDKQIGIDEITIVSPDGKEEKRTYVKIGDGETAWKDLNYIYANAADVPDWAKSPTKPNYVASEITGINDLVLEAVNNLDLETLTITTNKISDFDNAANNLIHNALTNFLISDDLKNKILEVINMEYPKWEPGGEEY